jgi:AcrR family transcriptional regulator
MHWLQRDASDLRHAEERVSGCGNAQREKILEEALKLVAQEGAERMTMRALAQRLGYSPAAIYLHFRSKEDLLQQLALCGFERLIQATEGAHQLADLREAIIEGGRRYLDFALENPALYRLMFEEIDLSRYRGDPSPFVPGRALFDLYRDLYTRAVRAGAIRCVDPEVHTVIGWSAVHGFAMLALSGRVPPPRMPEKSFGEMRDAFLAFLSESLRA